MKKIISLILTIALLATLMPTMLAGAASGEEVVKLFVTADTPIGPEANYLGSGNKANVYNGGSLSSYYLRNRSSSVMYGLHRVDLTGLSAKLTNKAVTKVEFCEYVVGDLPSDNTAYSQAGSAKYTNTVSVYPVSSDWDENTVTLKTWNEANHELSFNEDGYGAITTSTTPSETSCAFPAVAYGGTPQLVTMDVTGAYQQAMADGVDEDSQFSFLSVVQSGTGYAWINLAAREYAADEYRPYIKITLDDIPELAEASAQLPTAPSDDFALTLSNPIKTATVKVNDAEVDSSAYTVSGDTLTLDNYQLAPFTKYKVDVVIKDIYNQQFTKIYNFETSYDAATSEVFATEARYISATGNTTPGTNGTSVYNATEYAVAYRVALPSVPEGGYLESFKFSFWVWPKGGSDPSPDYSKWVKMYEYPSDAALDTLTLADISETLLEGNVINPAVTDKTHLWYSGASEEEKPLYTLRRYTVDATAYANRCLAEGDTSIVILATCEYTLKFMGVTVDSSVDGICHPTATSIINESPSITISGKDILPAGTTLKKADVTFITRFPASVTDYLALRTAEGKEEVHGITFTYDEAAGTVGIAEPVTGLSENTEYELVLKAGAQDNFNNSVTEDMVLQKFTTTVDFAVNELKILEDSFAAGTDDFDSATTLNTAAENDQIKAVCEIENNNQAKNVLIIIASYKDSSKSELSDVTFTGVTAELGENVYASEAITITSDTKYVKAFVWDGATYAPLTQLVDFER